MNTLSIQRVLDANVNRACEALRVLEDVARFSFNHAGLSAECKQARHILRQSLPAYFIAARDTGADVGTVISAADEYQRCNFAALISANAKRLQEALRVVEEHMKMVALAAASIEQLRYQSYTLEQRLQALVPGQRLWQEKLYILIDEDSCADSNTGSSTASLQLCAQLAAYFARNQTDNQSGGLIQYRAKQLSESEYYERAAPLRDACADKTLFIVNDHISVAAAIGASGVHLGQDDSAPQLARAVLGPLAVIGLSTHSLEQIQRAHHEPIDYIGIGPMYATQTKPHEPVRGPALLEAAAAQIQLPSYAIGGINEERIQELKSMLPHGVAVASVLCKAKDPIALLKRMQLLLDA